MHDDPVIDFMILEALHLRVQEEDAAAQEKAIKAAERTQFKQDFSKLESYR